MLNKISYFSWLELNIVGFKSYAKIKHTHFLLSYNKKCNKKIKKMQEEMF